MAERQHAEGCECVRCRGFEAGNELGVRHGAHSKLRLTKRAEELVDEVRELVGARYRAQDEPLVRLFAITWARIEAGAEGLESADDPDRFADLERRMQGWIRIARQLAADLGMSPTARSRLGLDVAIAARALNVTDLALAALELDDTRGDGDGTASGEEASS